jgi:PleD family two-component response regulator
MQDKYSILIVDDEIPNIRALSHILKADYNVSAVKSGIDALTTIDNHIPDLILLDVIMPEMDGFEVLSALKNNDKTKDIPVILITALNDEESEKMGISLGAVDYIYKPFTTTIVELRVKNHIKLMEALQENERLKNA